MYGAALTCTSPMARLIRHAPPFLSLHTLHSYPSTLFINKTPQERRSFDGSVDLASLQRHYYAPVAASAGGFSGGGVDDDDDGLSGGPVGPPPGSALPSSSSSKKGGAARGLRASWHPGSVREQQGGGGGGAGGGRVSHCGGGGGGGAMTARRGGAAAGVMTPNGSVSVLGAGTGVSGGGSGQLASYLMTPQLRKVRPFLYVCTAGVQLLMCSMGTASDVLRLLLHSRCRHGVT